MAILGHQSGSSSVSSHDDQSPGTDRVKDDPAPVLDAANSYFDTHCDSYSCRDGVRLHLVDTNGDSYTPTTVHGELVTADGVLYATDFHYTYNGILESSFSSVLSAETDMGYLGIGLYACSITVDGVILSGSYVVYRYDVECLDSDGEGTGVHYYLPEELSFTLEASGDITRDGVSYTGALGLVDIESGAGVDCDVGLRVHVRRENAYSDSDTPLHCTGGVCPIAVTAALGETDVFVYRQGGRWYFPWAEASVTLDSVSVPNGPVVSAVSLAGLETAFQSEQGSFSVTLSGSDGSISAPYSVTAQWDGEDDYVPLAATGAEGEYSSGDVTLPLGSGVRILAILVEGITVIHTHPRLRCHISIEHSEISIAHPVVDVDDELYVSYHVVPIDGYGEVCTEYGAVTVVSDEGSPGSETPSRETGRISEGRGVYFSFVGTVVGRYDLSVVVVGSEWGESGSVLATGHIDAAYHVTGADGSTTLVGGASTLPVDRIDSVSDGDYFDVDDSYSTAIVLRDLDGELIDDMPVYVTVDSTMEGVATVVTMLPYDSTSGTHSYTLLGGSVPTNNYGGTSLTFRLDTEEGPSIGHTYVVHGQEVGGHVVRMVTCNDDIYYYPSTSSTGTMTLHLYWWSQAAEIDEDLSSHLSATLNGDTLAWEPAVLDSYRGRKYQVKVERPYLHTDSEFAVYIDGVETITASVQGYPSYDSDHSTVAAVLPTGHTAALEGDVVTLRATLKDRLDAPALGEEVRFYVNRGLVYSSSLYGSIYTQTSDPLIATEVGGGVYEYAYSVEDETIRYQYVSTYGPFWTTSNDFDLVTRVTGIGGVGRDYRTVFEAATLLVPGTNADGDPVQVGISVSESNMRSHETVAFSSSETYDVHVHLREVLSRQDASASEALRVCASLGEGSEVCRVREEDSYWTTVTLSPPAAGRYALTARLEEPDTELDTEDVVIVAVHTIDGEEVGVAGVADMAELTIDDMEERATVTFTLDIVEGDEMPDTDASTKEPEVTPTPDYSAYITALYSDGSGNLHVTYVGEGVYSVTLRPPSGSGGTRMTISFCNTPIYTLDVVVDTPETPDSPVDDMGDIVYIAAAVLGVGLLISVCCCCCCCRKEKTDLEDVEDDSCAESTTPIQYVEGVRADPSLQAVSPGNAFMYSLPAHGMGGRQGMYHHGQMGTSFQPGFGQVMFSGQAAASGLPLVAPPMPLESPSTSASAALPCSVAE
ncbi:hypothetical protein KIPB_001091 [Kipferlia bialata]|uniref:Uncharacterized protein n=1 Tax=Kipferlia bialata TaxID=797122 RepID=A0A9K3CNA2_9EUKA|nr:hypothetical protein KIPB_001091 [Kipferlia bialata]|eukprot:g1091.t1